MCDKSYWQVSGDFSQNLTGKSKTKNFLKLFLTFV